MGGAGLLQLKVQKSLLAQTERFRYLGTSPRMVGARPTAATSPGENCCTVSPPLGAGPALMDVVDPPELLCGSQTTAWARSAPEICEVKAIGRTQRDGRPSGDKVDRA